MLSDEVIEKASERLVNRIEQANEYILEQIGKKIKQIYDLKSSEAHKLANILKYGGDYEKIVKKLQQITKLNVKDIEKIFKEVARNDYEFAKQFYDYRDKKYIPFEQNIALQRQIKAIADLTAKQYIDISRTKALGYSIRNNKGEVIFSGLKQTYNDAIDKAIQKSCSPIGISAINPYNKAQLAEMVPVWKEYCGQNNRKFHKREIRRTAFEARKNKHIQFNAVYCLGKIVGFILKKDGKPEIRYLLQ